MTDERSLRRRALIAGVVVIVVANGVALATAAYNRSGTPESTLELTDRELQLPLTEGRDRDDSGLSLSLDWRVVPHPARDTSHTFDFPYGGFGSPAWLDSAKLVTLGFRVTRPADTADARAYYRNRLARSALLVLEFDGPTSEMFRARVRAWAERERARVANRDTSERFLPQGQFVSQRLLEEERDASRLFVVDAGLDLDSLRARYPDRSRYAIVRGAVRPQLTVFESDPPRIQGYITELLVEEIHVPRQFRPALDSVRRTFARGRETVTSRYSVTVAFGRRLEPWITAVTRR